VNNLRKIREALNISQTALAELVGCSQGAIGHYEAGRRTPSLFVCRELVKALNRSGAKVQFDEVFPPELNAA